MRPLTEVMPKELLPVGRLPVLHHIVTELAKAGVSQIVVVSSPLKPAIAMYIDRVLIPEMGRSVTIETIHQGSVTGNGGAVLTAAEHIGGGPFLVVWGDEVFLGPSRTEQLLTAWRATQTPVISVVEVASKDVKGCGMILSSREVGSYIRIHSILEKPNPNQLASRTASVGGFLVTDSILNKLSTTPPRADGEVYLSEALATFAHTNVLLGCRLKAQWYETGSPEGYARAFNAVAKRDRLI